MQVRVIIPRLKVLHSRSDVHNCCKAADVQRAPIHSKHHSKLSHMKLGGCLAGGIAHRHLLLWSIVTVGVALRQGSSTLWVGLRPL